MNIKEAFASMSDDFKKKAANCKTKEEFEALIREENIELTPEQVEVLAGGKSCGCDCVCDYDCVIDACMLFPHGT